MDKRFRALPYLRGFNVAAKLSSFSLAADELALTQAAVSQQMRKLEEILEVKLFTRFGRRMELTVHGKILNRYVNEAFSSLSTGLDRMLTEALTGELVVAVTPSFASMWLVPRLSQFSAAVPGIKIKVIISNNEDTIRDAQIDLAILQGEVKQTQLRTETLYSDPVMPVCKPKLIEQIDLRNPSQLVQCQLVEATNPGHFNWAIWFTLAGVTAPAQQSWAEFPTWELGINAVLTGDRVVALAPQSLVEELIKTKRLVNPFPIALEPGLNFSLLYNPNSPRIGRINRFADWLKQQV